MDAKISNTIKPKVSVCVISYKQESYILDALRGIEIQDYDGPLEIIISDDASPDRTFEFIQSWVKNTKLNAHIHCFRHPENIGMHKNWDFAIKQCSGKYISMLEGDDYWISPHKISVQVDVLEKRQNLSFCFSEANVKNEVDSRPYEGYVINCKEEISFADLLAANIIPTCTVTFRRDTFPGFPQQFYKSPYADWILHLINLSNGNAAYIAEPLAAYRLNTQGVFGGSGAIQRAERLLRAQHIISDLFSHTTHAGKIKSNIKTARKKLRKEYLTHKLYTSFIKSHFE